MNDNYIQIHKYDVPLLIDVICYSCKRNSALSNTYETNGRRYCFNCYDKLFGFEIDKYLFKGDLK